MDKSLINAPLNIKKNHYVDIIRKKNYLTLENAVIQ